MNPSLVSTFPVRRRQVRSRLIPNFSPRIMALPPLCVLRPWDIISMGLCLDHTSDHKKPRLPGHPFLLCLVSLETIHFQVSLHLLDIPTFWEPFMCLLEHTVHNWKINPHIFKLFQNVSFISCSNRHLNVSWEHCFPYRPLSSLWAWNWNECPSWFELPSLSLDYSFSLAFL